MGIKNKNRINSIICFLLVCLLLTGCDTSPEQVLYNGWKGIKSFFEKNQDAAEDLASDVTGEITIELPEWDEEEIQEGEEKIELPQEEIVSQESNYAFNTLSETERAIYIEVYTIIKSMAENIQISTLDSNEIDKIFKCVMIDHPEFFYIEGYTMTKFTFAGRLQRILFSGTYTMDEDEKLRREGIIESYVSECLSGIQENASDYEKVKYIYDYLIKETEYDLNAVDNQNICSIFMNKKTVCQGYAKGTQLLLDRLGVFCTLVNGNVKSGEAHVWNLVQVDEKYYYVDTTWGDASYNLDIFQAENPDFDASLLPEINYDYLCVNEDMLLETHRIDTVIPLPSCVSLDENYYVKEGIYFSDLNLAQLEAVFRKAYENGENDVVIKCAGKNVYSDIYKHLITDENIFAHVKKGGSVSYMESESQYTLTFYI